MVFLLDTKIDETKNLIQALTFCYGISKTNSLKILVKFGINKNFSYKDIPNFIQNQIDINIITIVEKKLKLKIGVVLKHFENNALKIIKSLKNYRSIRHNQFLPVRGQRTHTNAKTQKSKLKNRIKVLKKKN
jgi:small subunit ribosomal protein S13